MSFPATASSPGLFPFLETVLQSGGKKTGDVKSFHNVGGYSGYEYSEGETVSRISLGMILGGTGYVITRLENDGTQIFDYYNTQGEHTFSSDHEALKVLLVDSYQMDLSCPILNHLYNFLSYEYKQAAEAKTSTELVHSVELFLRRLYQKKSIRLPVEEGVNDGAITNVYNKILKIELDPVLTWEERHIVFDKHKDVLDIIVSTKTRAHKLSKVVYKLALLKKDWGNFLARFITRPANNAQGILYRYTMGKVIWFFQTVRNNLGYSVALAVYGPFTYYFITMPMNPHAMQAVGRVRSTYLDVKTEISRFMDDEGKSLSADLTAGEAVAGPKIVSQKQDQVSTVNAAPAKGLPTFTNVIMPSLVTVSQEPLMLRLNGQNQQVSPTLMNMVVSTDVPMVNQQNWLSRMSDFKQMQIGYEENIEYASRMGRLEQLETQYNFPMQVESTWEELERYNNLIYKFRAETPNLSPKMKQYLVNESNRTQQLQLYLWDRMGRFILDQVYVMLDQDNEQKRSDYYVGRSFVFMQEMTDILSWRYKNFKKPEGYDRIEKLATFYARSRKEHGSVLKNLAENSDLFKQKDIYSTKEFRSYMKRQWEILYLQNAKAEEAANMGLNMYIWSVRNTVWILQSIYSAKRDELPLLVKRDTSGQLFSPTEQLSRSRTSMLYETLVHNLTLEYVGIREEIMNRLGKDIESAQRMTVIDNLKEFLTDREKLDGIHTGLSQNSQGTKL